MHMIVFFHIEVYVSRNVSLRWNGRCSFSRVSTLTRDINIAILCVCLSVRCVPVFYGDGLTQCHHFTAR